MTLWQRMLRNFLKTSTKPKHAASGRSPEPARDPSLTGDLRQTARAFSDLLGENDDFISREFHLFGVYPANLIYFSSLVDPETVNREILKPLMTSPSRADVCPVPVSHLKETLLHDLLYFAEGEWVDEFQTAIEALMRGASVIIVDGIEAALLLNTRKVDKRSIEQPYTEQVIRGPREGYIEPLETNLSLLRYRLPTAKLKVKSLKIGRMTKTKVAVCYLEGITNPKLVQEVLRRLSQIDIDGILDSGYLEQFLSDNRWTPFPLMQTTERPDKTAAALMEGRVAILTDGSPFALLAPVVFSVFYQVVSDYIEKSLISSFIRLSRFVALIFSLIFPSLYVSVISFNPELIPTEFAVAVAGGRAGVPFPAVIEVLLMEISMEVLREATIRMPQQVGGALSIVGVLVVGQAAVEAGFASPITVVIVALTTIGSFATPAYEAAQALRILRFPLVILAGIFGLYGVMAGLILITNHMLSLKSFGIPYFSPVIPGNVQGMKDSIFRSQLWMLKKRPEIYRTLNTTKVGNESQAFQPPHNTLDPVGYEGRQEEHGTSASGDRRRGGDGAH
jgi:spore germination protein KA